MFEDNRNISRDPARPDAYLNDPAVGEGSGYGPLVALVRDRGDHRRPVLLRAARRSAGGEQQSGG